MGVKNFRNGHKEGPKIGEYQMDNKSQIRGHIVGVIRQSTGSTLEKRRRFLSKWVGRIKTIFRTHK